MVATGLISPRIRNLLSAGLVRAVLVILLSIGISPASVFAHRSNPVSILILHSYHSTFEWVRAIQGGIEDTISRSHHTLNLYVEHMDSKRLDAHFDPEAFFSYLDSKYVDVTPELIIVSDGPALEFISTYSESIFMDTPVLYCGISQGEIRAYSITPDGTSDPKSSRQILTGVLENIDIRETLNLGIALWPGRDKVVVLTDATAIGTGNREVLQSIESEYQDRLTFEYIVPTTLTDLRIALSTLPADAVVLYNHFVYTDREGYMPFDWIVPEIVQASSAPILATHDFMIVSGASGGFVADGYKQGAAVAEQALRYIHGDDPGAVVQSPNTAMVQEPELVRFNANQNALPPDAIVLNRSPGFIESNRWVIGVSLGSLGFFIFLSVFLILLSAQRQQAFEKIKSLNDELSETVGEKTVLLNEVHHRTKNNLQVLESMVSLQLIGEPSESLMRFRDRIRAIGLVHRQLYDRESISRIDLGEYISGLIYHLSEFYVEESQSVDSPTRVYFSPSQETIEVGMDVAVPFGLVINECVTNSLRHATNEDNQHQTVSINMGLVDGSGLMVTIRDDGPGFATIPPAKSGLGMKLIDGLIRQIGGNVEYTNQNGAMITITIRDIASA